MTDTAVKSKMIEFKVIDGHRAHVQSTTAYTAYDTKEQIEWKALDADNIAWSDGENLITTLMWGNQSGAHGVCITWSPIDGWPHSATFEWNQHDDAAQSAQVTDWLNDQMQRSSGNGSCVYMSLRNVG